MTSNTVAEIEESARMWAAGMWVVKLDQGELSDVEMSEWIEWCESDPKNAAAYQKMQSLWWAAAKHPPQVPDPAVALKPFKIPRWVGVAASIAAILAVALPVLSQLDKENWGLNPAELSVSPVDSVQTAVGTNQHAILPDGSIVEIGARSVLDVDFADAKRELKLRYGQAYFRVKHDVNHPFTVDAGNVRVIAVGTAFDVRRSGSEIAITVQEGTVKAFRTNGDAHALKADAGYQLVFDASTGKTRQSIVDPSVAVGWREGRLEFTGDTLEVVIASVNRYSSRRIVLEDPSLGGLVFTGTVFVDSIDSSLDAMQQVFPLQIHRTEHEVVLSKRR